MNLTTQQVEQTPQEQIAAAREVLIAFYHGGYSSSNIVAGKLKLGWLDPTTDLTYQGTLSLDVLVRTATELASYFTHVLSKNDVIIGARDLQAKLHHWDSPGGYLQITKGLTLLSK